MIHGENPQWVTIDEAADCGDVTTIALRTENRIVHVERARRCGKTFEKAVKDGIAAFEKLRAIEAAFMGRELRVPSCEDMRADFARPWSGRNNGHPASPRSHKKKRRK